MKIDSRSFADKPPPIVVGTRVMWAIEDEIIPLDIEDVSREDLAKSLAEQLDDRTSHGIVTRIAKDGTLHVQDSMGDEYDIQVSDLIACQLPVIEDVKGTQ